MFLFTCPFYGVSIAKKSERYEKKPGGTTHQGSTETGGKLPSVKELCHARARSHSERRPYGNRVHAPGGRNACDQGRTLVIGVRSLHRRCRAPILRFVYCWHT